MLRTSAALAALAIVSTSVAQVACGLDKHCPEATPCCSQYGQCGIGAYCLGGCEPRASFTLDSCTPEPVCKSQSHTFKDLSRIMPKTKYLGDPNSADWVMDGDAVIFNNNVLLTMAPDTVGTLLASSTYMWYGNVKAKLKTSRGAGVVTAFILLSDVKDEIDYEFVGTGLSTAQTNFYFQGIPNYSNGGNISLSDTFNNYHTYEIDWTPEQITWSVDGQVGRTVKKSDTWNSTANQYYYPQTPSRVQLSLWPGGLPSNGKGTIDWAGGLVDWNSADIRNNGYYYASFESVTMTCFQGKSGGVSYTYNSTAGTENNVITGNKPTALKSLQGTGLHMDAGDPANSASRPSSSAESVPGLSGAGPGLSGAAQNGASSDAGPGAGTGSNQPTNGFTQGGNNNRNAGDKLGSSKEKMLGGSVFAVIVAVVAMMAL